MQSLPASGNQSSTNPPTPTSVAAVNLEVPRPPALIRCDQEPVRVTVGLLDLQPRYQYVTAPKRSLHAYLKATAVNRSDFYILAGQTNIYADNTFIGKVRKNLGNTWLADQSIKQDRLLVKTTILAFLTPC